MATIHQAVLEFMQGREDSAIVGAHAVNAYVDLPRMTSDVDILSLNAEVFAEDIKQSLADRFHIEIVFRKVTQGVGFRLYQIREPQNRHLVDVRQIDSLPPTQIVQNVQVIAPAELIAMKVISMAARAGKAKGLTDEADLLRLLLAFPQLKSKQSEIEKILTAHHASEQALQIWQAMIIREIEPDDDDAY